MPPRSPRLQFPEQVVTAVVVVHDGSRWLAECLESLRAQRRRPQRLVIVDTGSIDGSADVARAAADDVDVVSLSRETRFADAVGAGVAAADALPSARRRGPAVVHWVWLLHDDSYAAPDALLELLAEADRSASATVLGCKQTDLDGHRLVEMGLTVDGSGRRRTTVEPHEVDQGQHDELRDVLAVSTAGMLVRRDVWDRLGGLDPTWAFSGEDVDFGWRANAAGERVVVVPRAVVRHAFALTDGQRCPDAARRPGRVRRLHEIQVLWANAGRAVLPLVALRAVLGGWLVALARLTSGDFRGARDEAGAVASALRHPSTVAAARRRRRPLRVRSHRELRPLLGSASAQVRRDIAARFGHWRMRDGAEARRRGWRHRPLLWLSLALVALAVVADRGVLSGTLHGGRLLPAPSGASDLWSTYRAGWHPVGLGSTAPAPPWLAALAAISTVLLAKPWLAVAVIMLGAVPLAGWTAYAAGSRLTRSRWLRAWAAVAYALLPVGLGAVATGRLDVVVALILLPITARAVVSAIAPDPSTRTRPVAAGLLLAVSAAFAPLLWAALGVAALAVILVAVRPVGRSFGRLLLVLGAAFVVLLPWSWHVAAHPSLALAGSGLPDTFRLARPQPAADFVLLHPGGPAQPPAWLVAGYLLAAVAGLSRTARNRAARAAFAAFVVSAGAALAVSRLDVAGVTSDSRYWTGIPLAVAGLSLLCSCLVAADGARAVLARHSFGLRQVTAMVITAGVAVATVGSAVVWISRGVAGPLTGGNPQLLPPFAAATVALPTSPRALVLRPGGDGVGYALVRSASGPRLGDADATSETAGSREAAGKLLDDAVARLVGGDPDAATLLTELGIGQVADRGGDDRQLAGLSRVDGLTAVPASGVVVRRVSSPTGELIVLAAGPAARARSGGSLPPSARPVPLAAGAGRARTRLPAGPPGRLLVLAEPADAHWRATVNGRSLPRARAYGWAQAWSLPATGGRLTVSRTSDGRGKLLLGELAVLVVLALAARPHRRSAARPT